MRGSFDLAWLVRIACTLSFLSSMGVKKVHLFGSSRREVIFIGAAALGLQMFDQVSFDSRTWNTLLFDKRPKYFDTKTLKGYHIKNEKIIDILTPTRLITKLKIYPFNSKNRKRLLMLHNALAISQFSDEMARRAKDIDKFKKYISNQCYLASKRDRLLVAIDILNMSVKHGYDFVEKWLR